MNVYFLVSKEVEIVEDYVEWTPITHPGVFIGFVVAPYPGKAREWFMLKHSEVAEPSQFHTVKRIARGDYEPGYVDYENAPPIWQSIATGIMSNE